MLAGRVLRAHGLRGDVLVDVRTDDPGERFAPGARLQAVRAGEPGRDVVVAAAAVHADHLRVRFDGTDDRTAAEALRGLELYVDTPPADHDDPDVVHDTRLVGLAVVDPAGAAIGTVTDVLHPAQDVLVVSAPDGRQALVPFVRALVPEVDLPGGRLVVDLPDGLLDLDG